jgi:type IV secretory pathway protease TraF
LRADKAGRRRRLHRLSLGAIGLAALLATAAAPPLPRLVWNATASAPRGLYYIDVGGPVAAGDLVAARLPTSVRTVVAQRHILPLRAVLVKRVVAVAGADICAVGNRIFVDERPVARRLERDRQGRALPRWRGCQRLRGAQFLLLSPHPQSFDGRYFGPSDGADLVGRAVLLWRS